MCFGQAVSSEPTPDANPAAIAEQNTAAQLESQKAGVKFLAPGASSSSLSAGTGAGLAQTGVSGTGTTMPRGGAGTNLAPMLGM